MSQFRGFRHSDGRVYERRFVVEFAGATERFEWIGLLDTGSRYTVLPGHAPTPAAAKLVAKTLPDVSTIDVIIARAPGIPTQSVSLRTNRTTAIQGIGAAPLTSYVVWGSSEIFADVSEIIFIDPEYLRVRFDDGHKYIAIIGMDSLIGRGPLGNRSVRFNNQGYQLI